MKSLLFLYHLRHLTISLKTRLRLSSLHLNIVLLFAHLPLLNYNSVSTNQICSASLHHQRRARIYIISIQLREGKQILHKNIMIMEWDGFIHFCIYKLKSVCVVCVCFGCRYVWSDTVFVLIEILRERVDGFWIYKKYWIRIDVVKICQKFGGGRSRSFIVNETNVFKQTT